MSTLAPFDTSTLETSGPWFSKVLASIGDTNLRFRVMRDTARPFHVHERSPECFFVVTGVVHIDTEEGGVSLSQGQFFEVRPGLKHRARVEGDATLLVFDALAAWAFTAPESLRWASHCCAIGRARASGPFDKA